MNLPGSKENEYKKYLICVLIIFLLKALSLGIYPFVHLSEARYSTIAMRMELTGNYLMPYFDPTTPFFAKPPLAFWASAISFKIFGFNEFAGRLPHFLALIAICFLLYYAVAKISDKKAAIISVIVLASCAIFYTLQSVMTEAFLLLGMAMITLSFWLQIESEKPKNIYGYLFFLGCVIAMLSKGPVGIIMPGFPIFVYMCVSARWKELFKKFPIFTGTIIFIGLALPWFYLAEIKYPGFLQYFFIGENFSRFTEPGWNGDRYGHAHEVPLGMIWGFLVIATLPVILLFFIYPKQIAKIFLEKIKNTRNQTFLFFFISFALPMVILSFMRNMIMTYPVYALIPLVVLTALIISEKRWYKFANFLAYFTIAIYCLVIAAFLIYPPKLAEYLNRYAFLVHQIPREVSANKDFELYHLGKDRNLFSLSWYSKDKLKILNEENFSEIINSDQPSKYVIGDESDYLALPQKYQVKLNKIDCTPKRQTCLYESSH